MASSAATATPRRRGWLGGVRSLYARPSSALGTTLVAVFLVLAALGPLATPYGATEQVFTDRSQPPSLRHLFGTDHLGRDVFSRVVAGDRDIFLLAGSGTLIAVLVGTLVGLLAT
ncbi:MAG: glutathione ABC transporter permease GsiD, partial [Deinococcales bacterium]